MSLHTYRSEKITVTWDGRRCTHAAECLRCLPGVFNTGERPWVQPDKASVDEVAAAVMRCPTGALHYVRHDSSETEPKPERNEVRVLSHGPLWIRGDVVLVNAEGETTLEDTRLSLCRCGASANKPHCDNSHRWNGFADRGRMQENKLVTKDPAPDGARLRITVNRNGSFKLQGPLTIRFADGTEVTGNTTSLCRCGQSKNKPFCDGTHKETGFIAD